MSTSSSGIDIEPKSSPIIETKESQKSLTMVRDDLDDAIQKARVVQLASIQISSVMDDPDVRALPSEVGNLIQQLEDLKEELKSIDHKNENI